MLRYMLDTNTCIRTMHANAAHPISGRFNRHAKQLCISSIVLAELHYGAQNSRRVSDNLDEIELFVDRLEGVLDFDQDAAAAYGRIRAALRKSPIGPLDTLIASHALSRNLIVVTSNTREFGRVPGLGIEDWT
jgi:tRNA(fMet)-specific endonuclease VapC